MQIRYYERNLNDTMVHFLLFIDLFSFLKVWLDFVSLEFFAALPCVSV